MFCHNCGIQLTDDSRFCHNCGAEQLFEEPVAPAPAAAPVINVQEAPPVQAQPENGAETPQPSSTGTYTWNNVKISGEIKDGVGTLTITFS